MDKIEFLPNLQAAKKAADNRSMERGDDQHIYVVKMRVDGRQRYGILLEEDYSELCASLVAFAVVSVQNGRNARFWAYD